MANLPGVRVALTLPLNIRERLEQLADAEHRTMSQQVAFWVEQACKTLEAGKQQEQPE